MWKLLRSAFFLGDAETVHSFTVKGCQKLATIAPGFLKSISEPDPSPKKANLFGKEFQSVIGLAAGFDKNAELLPALPLLGFGFAEIGTVTPLPQKGNRKPRLFRFPQEENLWNSMGFNNDGAIAIAHRVEEHRKNLPPLFRVGVNVGKNKDTPLEQAHLDYAKAVTPFIGLADYFVVNVSSPNTVGLRSLQEKESLQRITNAVRHEQAKKGDNTPLLLKLAPELDSQAFDSIFSNEKDLGIDGFVLTNTLQNEYRGRMGGLSGRCLTDKSRDVLKQARQRTQLPLISVGGISNSDEARLRLQSGASLIQFYSSWIFQGPRFPGMISREI